MRANHSKNKTTPDLRSPKMTSNFNNRESSLIVKEEEEEREEKKNDKPY
jgi:hypothetical protein